jgi:hypothetical protein
LSPIVFNLNRECLIKESLEGVRILKKEGKTIFTIKYTDDFVLPAKEEFLLQGLIAKVHWNGNECVKN